MSRAALSLNGYVISVIPRPSLWITCSVWNLESGFVLRSTASEASQLSNYTNKLGPIYEKSLFKGGKTRKQATLCKYVTVWWKLLVVLPPPSKTSAIVVSPLIITCIASASKSWCALLNIFRVRHPSKEREKNGVDFKFIFKNVQPKGTFSLKHELTHSLRKEV